jgi:hypothetical protein
MCFYFLISILEESSRTSSITSKDQTAFFVIIGLLVQNVKKNSERSPCLEYVHFCERTDLNNYCAYHIYIFKKDFQETFPRVIQRKNAQPKSLQSLSIKFISYRDCPFQKCRALDPKFTINKIKFGAFSSPPHPFSSPSPHPFSSPLPPPLLLPLPPPLFNEMPYRGEAADERASAPAW